MPGKTSISRFSDVLPPEFKEPGQLTRRSGPLGGAWDAFENRLTNGHRESKPRTDPYPRIQALALEGYTPKIRNLKAGRSFPITSSLKAFGFFGIRFSTRSRKQSGLPSILLEPINHARMPTARINTTAQQDASFQRCGMRRRSRDD